MVRKILINASSSVSVSTIQHHHRSNSTSTSVDPLSLSEHDDSSVSSTISVDHLPRKELHVSDESSSPVSRKRIALIKKHVHFDLTRTVYHEDDTTTNAMDIDDENDTGSTSSSTSSSSNTRWYTATEYREFKALAQDASNQIIRIEARNRAPYSYQRVMEHVYTSCMLHPQSNNTSSSSVLPDSELVHLQRWLDVATSRLGLEKWSIRKITKDKSYRRREIVKTVLNLQSTIQRQQQSQCQQQSFLSLSPVSTSEPTVTVDTIRTACEAISQPSRLYAQTMAVALASTVTNSSSTSNTSLSQ